MTLAVQCCNRGPPFGRSHKICRTHHRHRPGKDVFSGLFGRISVVPSLGSNLLRPVELGSIDPHAMHNDRELTRDCTLCLAEPVALGEPYPPGLHRGPFWDAGQQHPGCFFEGADGSEHHHVVGNDVLGSAAMDRADADHTEFGRVFRSFSRLITLCTSTMKRAAIITGSVVA